MFYKLYYENDIILWYCHNMICISQRLSAEMSHKVSSDERTLENISVDARPMKLADEFRKLCSDGWLVANEALEEMAETSEIHDDGRYRILNDVMKVRNSFFFKSKILGLISISFLSFSYISCKRLVYYSSCQNCVFVV